MRLRVKQPSHLTGIAHYAHGIDAEINHLLPSDQCDVLLVASLSAG